MYKFILNLILNFKNIFFFAFIVKVEFMIMFGNAELATNPFMTVLSNANNLFHEIVLWAFQDFVHWYYLWSSY